MTIEEIKKYYEDVKKNGPHSITLIMFKEAIDIIIEQDKQLDSLKTTFGLHPTIK